MNSQFCNDKMGFSQNYLLSRFVRNAQRTKKIPFFIRKNRLNSFRRTKPVSVALQISRDSSLALRVTLSHVILTETKDLEGLIEGHLQHF